MDEYIKKSEAVDVIFKYPYDIAGKTATAIKMIEDLPSADVVLRAELARGILADVNMQIIPYSTDIYIKGEELIIIPKSDYNAILAELKKKYTEGEDKPAATEEKYFSPEDVSKMTPQEVREKYTAIRKSMEMW